MRSAQDKIRYRRVSSEFWNDAKVLGLSNEGKLAFLFVLTHPSMTSLGMMRGTIPGLAAELGWTSKALLEAFSEAFTEGMAQVSTEAPLIVIPNFLKHNKPESPNVVKSWAKILPGLPDCALKAEHLQRVKAFTEGLGKAFAKAYPKACPIPRTQNPEPYIEISKEISLSESEDEDAQTDPTLTRLQELKDAWNAMAKANGLSTIREWGKSTATTSRAAMARARVRDPDWWAAHTEALAAIPRCSFLLGKNPRGWKADADWFVKPDSLTKILEGKYDDRDSATQNLAAPGYENPENPFYSEA